MPPLSIIGAAPALLPCVLPTLITVAPQDSHACAFMAFMPASFLTRATDLSPGDLTPSAVLQSGPNLSLGTVREGVAKPCPQLSNASQCQGKMRPLIL